jgi:histidinol-phosphate/aromatic aminotransferase/cobyric acid decarboxylase-like protein
VASGAAPDVPASRWQGIMVWVMTSWTKIWSCTGVRLGSVVAPTPDALKHLKTKQVPWSLNCVALVSPLHALEVEENQSRDTELYPTQPLMDRHQAI